MEYMCYNVRKEGDFLKKVAVINDLSGFGKCSLTAAIPVLSVQGVQACPLPTAVLSNQTGYEEYYCRDLTESMPEFIKNWQKLDAEFDGILTGFISSEKQIDIIRDFCRVFRKKDTLLMVDPVMADNGAVYPTFSPSLCEKITALALSADIITPNLTEFALIAGIDFAEIEKELYKESLLSLLNESAKPVLSKGVRYIIVTGVRIYEGKISNCIISKDGIQTVSAESFHGSFSGTGDIFASIVCGETVKGSDIFTAVSKAVKFIEIALKATVTECTRTEDGICFEPFLKLL